MPLISTDFLVPPEILRGEIEQTLTSAKLLDYPMLNVISKEDVYQSELQWPVNLGGSGASGRATSAAPGVSTQDTVKQAALPIGGRVINHVFSLNLNEVVQAARTAPQALKNLLRSHIQSGSEAILERLSTLVYTGDGTDPSDGVIGLDKVVDATYAYAGLDPVTYTRWTSYVNTSGTNRALTTDLLFDVESGMATKGGTYSAVFMNPSLVVKYKKVFENRLAVDQVNGVADLGFSGLALSGRPIIMDPRSTNNNIYFVNGADVSLCTFALNAAIGQLSLPSLIVNVQGLNVLISQLPISNPHVVTYEMSVQAQLKVKNRRSVALLGKITQ
ncbi:hypothetical protein LEP3755_34090 [Leptolyngbya sp. NIES-3755]|nr:hypothetical protein LEP3755_34090 [Leptolyngbya sp. NIES-3755]